MNAQKRIALITGAAKRIGQALALKLASEGLDIVLHYRESHQEAEQTAEKIRALGRRVCLSSMDLAQSDRILHWFEQITQDFGAVTVLVNNASQFSYDQAQTLNAESFLSHQTINVLAPLLLVQAMLKATTQNCVVVNLLDQKLYNPNPDFFSYTLSKANLQHATILLTQAYAPRLRAVGIAPGITLASAGQTSKEFKRAFQHTPLQHASNLDDITGAVWFVIDNQSISGSTLLVDGAQHLYKTSRDIMFLTTDKTQNTSV